MNTRIDLEQFREAVDCAITDADIAKWGGPSAKTA